MTILAEDGSVPRRRSPPAHLSSFPPRAPLASLNGNYHSVPTADYSPYAPYDDEPPRRSTRSRDWDDQGDFGESLSPPRTAWHRLARHSKARNKTIKTAALGLAGVALLYLLCVAPSPLSPSAAPPPCNGAGVFLRDRAVHDLDRH